MEDSEVTEWLDVVGLPEFAQKLFEAGVRSVDAVAALNENTCDQVPPCFLILNYFIIFHVFTPYVASWSSLSLCTTDPWNFRDPAPPLPQPSLLSLFSIQFD